MKNKKHVKSFNEATENLNIPVVSGWRLFIEEKPLNGERYHYSQGNQFFKGIWYDELKGFLLDGCGNKYLSITCDYFHAYH